jgi:hypothetical protein
MTLPSTFHLFFIFFGTGFEVLTVVRIHNAVWVRTPYSLVHGYECFGGAFSVCLRRQSEDGGSMYWLKPQCPPVRLYRPITLETIILNLNFLHCIIITKQLKAVNTPYYFTLYSDVSRNMSEQISCKIIFPNNCI